MLDFKLKDKINSLDKQFVGIIVIAALLRFISLSLKPPHHDEGINGWFADQMLFNGFYNYDSENYHGPLHFYIVFLFQVLFGKSEFILRLPTVIVSIISVYWITKFSSFFGKGCAYAAALILAISPAFVFYGRYAIHETDLLFFFILMFWGIIGLYNEGELKYLIGLCFGVCGIILTKETYIIHFACMVIAWIVLILWEKIIPTDKILPASQKWKNKELAIILGICFLLLVFFYSGTFLDFNGLGELLKSFQPWIKTGTASSGGHAKPFKYWFTLVLKYEPIMLLSMIISFRYLFFKGNMWIRYFAIYSIGVFLAYSIIPYKTPWCIMSIVWTLSFVIADFVMPLLNSRFRVQLILIVAFLMLNSFITTIKLNFINYENEKEPYVYVQTSNELKKLTSVLNNRLKVDPRTYDLNIQLLRDGDWPLPWVLSDYSMVGYYNNLKIKPNNYDADVLIVQKGRSFETEENLKDSYYTEDCQIRPSQDISKLFFKYKTFKDILSDRQVNFIPKPKIPVKEGEGLIASFYQNEKWSGNVTLKKQYGEVDIFWESNLKPIAAPFSALFEGEIYIPSPDTKLILHSDDGGFVEVDNIKVINDPGPHGVTPFESGIIGSSGWKKIKVGFYDIGGGAVVKLTYKIGDQEKKVPSSYLRYQ